MVRAIFTLSTSSKSTIPPPSIYTWLLLLPPHSVHSIVGHHTCVFFCSGIAWCRYYLEYRMKHATVVATATAANPFFNAKGQALSFKEVIALPELAHAWFVNITNDSDETKQRMINGFFFSSKDRIINAGVVQLLKSVLAHMLVSKTTSIALAIDHSQNNADGTVTTTFRSPELGENTYVPTKAGKDSITMFIVGAESVRILGSIAADKVATTAYDAETETFTLRPSNMLKAWLQAVA